MFNRFWRWLQSDSTPTPRRHGNPDLNPIDIARLAKELNLEQEAETLGKRDLPASDATTLAGIEFRIIDAIERTRRAYADWGTNRERLLNETINGIDLTPHTQRAFQLDTEFERRAAVLLSERGAVIQQLSALVRERKAEFDAFRKANRLERPVHYLTGLETWIRVLVLVGLVTVEGAVNSFFFAQGMWGGLLEGFFFAIIFAAVNVGLASAYGRFLLPQVFHINPGRRLAGYVLLAVALVLVLAMALIIAHYRDAVVGGALESAARVAWDTFKSSPHTLNDINSVVLCAISVAFALAAVYDAFGLDDPYPGYGKCARRKDNALKDHAMEMDAVRTQLEELKAETLEDLDALIDRAEVQLAQLDQAIAQKSETANRLANAFSDADSALAALLATFRTQNELHRSTPRPAYFSWPPPTAQVAQPTFRTEDDRAKYATQKAALEDGKKRVDPVRAAIQGAYSRLYDRLQSLEEHFATAPSP